MLIGFPRNRALFYVIQAHRADERHGESSMTAQQVNWLQIFLRRIRFAAERA
jgi:hypothetical protein